MFRFSGQDFKENVCLWKDFFALNLLICDQLIGFFGFSRSCTPSSFSRTSSCSRSDVDLSPTVEAIHGETSNESTPNCNQIAASLVSSPGSVSSNKDHRHTFAHLYETNDLCEAQLMIHKSFQQIHNDQINKCFYLIGTFENFSYMRDRYGLDMRANNAQELLSIEPTIKLVKNNPKLLSLNTCNLEYWTSNAIKGHEFVGNFIGNYGMGQEFYYNTKSSRVD